MSYGVQKWHFLDYLKVIPAIFTAVIIFYYSSLSNPYPVRPSNFSLFILNPMLHICEFGAFSFLLFFGLHPRLKDMLLISIAFLYAFFDEIHQLFVPSRYFDINDLLFDLSGLLFGYLAYIIYDLVRQSLRKKFKNKDIR